MILEFREDIGQSIEGKNKGRNFQWPVVEQKVVDRELTIDSNNWFSPTKLPLSGGQMEGNGNFKFNVSLSRWSIELVLFLDNN